MAQIRAGQPDEIVLAKITAPRSLPLSLERDRTVAALIDRMRAKIVTIEAPAGYSKTAVMGQTYQRLAEQGWKVCWLSIDEHDDERRVWAHALAALGQVLPDLDASAFSGLLPDNRERFAHALSNFLMTHAQSADDRYALFVDDLQNADRSVCACLLNTVARYFPENMHLVAAGTLLLWQNVDLSYRDKVSVFSADELRFSKPEVTQVLHNALELRAKEGFDDAPETSVPDELDGLAAELWDLTRGWPYGVRVYADALARGTLEPSARVDERSLSAMLSSFFRSSVFDRMSEESREFVKVISIPDKVCAELAGVLTGRSDSKSALRQLQVEGCLIAPISREPGWYSFYPLFHQWLRKKRNQMDPRALNDLCRKASSWFEEHGQEGQAAKCLLLASDHGLLESLSAAAGFQKDEQSPSYAERLDQTPATEFERSPYFSLQAAWAYICAGRPKDGWHWVDTFERIVAENPNGQKETGQLAARIVRVKCLELECRYDETIERGQALLAECGGQISLSQQCMLLHLLAEAHMHRGNLDEALRAALKAEAIAELGNSPFYLAICRICLIAIDTLQGKYNEALELVEKALRDCPEGINPRAALYSQKSYLCVETARYDEALECVERARKIVFGANNKDMFFEEEAERAWALFAGGQQPHAFQIIMKTALMIGPARIARAVDILVYHREAWIALGMGYISEARDAIAQLEARSGEGDPACDLACVCAAAAVADEEGSEGPACELAEPLERAREAGLVPLQIELLIRASIRFSRQGDHAKALSHMTRALRLQAGQNICGPFLRAGVEARSVLHEIVDVRQSAGQVRQLAKSMLRRFGPVREEEEDQGLADAALVERYGLSERECEVLELLNTGLSRREIAETLSISLNTVKSHVSSIYGKLGVTNRMDAFSLVYGNDR